MLIATILLIAATVAGVLGVRLFEAAESVMHEIVAMIAVLISAVLACSGLLYARLAATSEQIRRSSDRIAKALIGATSQLQQGAEAVPAPLSGKEASRDKGAATSSGAAFLCLLALVGIGVLVYSLATHQNRVGITGSEDKDQSRPVSGVETIPDAAPSWYTGTKPWSSIDPQGRRDILNMRANYEATKAAAEKPSEVQSPEASRGRELVARMCDRYQLDAYYKTPRMFGPRMVIWIPEDAWSGMSSQEQSAVVAWISSEYTNWGIGVGRVSGRDVLSDRLVMQK